MVSAEKDAAEASKGEPDLVSGIKKGLLEEMTFKPKDKKTTNKKTPRKTAETEE